MPANRPATNGEYPARLEICSLAPVTRSRAITPAVMVATAPAGPSSRRRHGPSSAPALSAAVATTTEPTRASAGLPALALVGSVVVATAALSAGALLGPWRRRLLGPAGAVATITAGVIALDLVTGARLQISSLAGYSPLVAGRFAGIGNAAYGVFAPAVLLAGAALAGAAVAGAAQTGAAHARTAAAGAAGAGTALAGRSRQVALAITAVLGLVAIVVDGSPAWGSDVGGVLALMPGVAVLVLGCAGYRVSWSRLAAAGAAGVAVVAGFAVADYQRPVPARTHLGRFVDQLLHGGAGAVIRRKAQANAELLLHSVWSVSYT